MSRWIYDCVRSDPQLHDHAHCWSVCLLLQCLLAPQSLYGTTPRLNFFCPSNCQLFSFPQSRSHWFSFLRFRGCVLIFVSIVAGDRTILCLILLTFTHCGSAGSLSWDNTSTACSSSSWLSRPSLLSAYHPLVGSFMTGLTGSRRCGSFDFFLFGVVLPYLLLFWFVDYSRYIHMYLYIFISI